MKYVCTLDICIFREYTLDVVIHGDFLNVNRCGHTESGRTAEFDKAELLQTVQSVHASLSVENSERLCEKMKLN